jgi:hypothetical protein
MPNERDASTVEYVNLLYKYGVGSKEAKEYKQAHADDKVFLTRARGAERLFEYKDEILTELDRMPKGGS